MRPGPDLFITVRINKLVFPKKVFNFGIRKMSTSSDLQKTKTNSILSKRKMINHDTNI